MTKKIEFSFHSHWKLMSNQQSRCIMLSDVSVYFKILLSHPPEKTDHYAPEKLFQEEFLLADFYRLSQLHNECLPCLIQLQFNVWLRQLLDILQAIY